jgi:PAS domain S-box-containing protein
MDIDIRTIILIIGIAHLMLVLVFYHQYKANPDLAGPGWWLVWSATEFFGFGLILLRGIPSLLPFIIVFQNVIILLGTIFVYVGLMRFFSKKVNLKLVIPFFVSYVILHLFFSIVDSNIEIRTLLLDISISLVGFYTAHSIYINRTRPIASMAIFITTIFAIHGSVFVYRSVMIIKGVSVTDIYSPSIFNLAQYLDALLVGLLWTFGFIMMMNQRLNVEISEAKSRFEMFFNTSPDAAIITRLEDGKFVDCNEGFTKISGYTKEDISGKSSLDIQLWKNPDDRNEIVKRIKEKGFLENYELLFQLKTGKVITGLMSASEISLYGIPHIMSVTRDISDRKQNEVEIQQKNDELRKLNAEKDKFFSIIAHDLRSPFSGFLGLTEIMAEDLPNMGIAEAQEIALSLSKSANNIYRLLNNLLEWSQIQNGSISFNPEIVQLRPIIEESIAMTLESARAKEIEISLDFPDGLKIFADTYMLQAIFRNLISNAIKYTQKGGKVNVLARTTDDKNIEIFVRDSGIGMSQEMIDNLFRIDVITNRLGTDGEPTSGLGLMLCKEFVEKHGSKIRVKSEVGVGTVFNFYLPISVEKEENFSQ